MSPDRRTTPDRRTALITGASAGIGKTFAAHLAAEGYDLMLVARRADRLDELSERLGREHGVRCEVFAGDLSDPATPGAIIEHAEEAGLGIDVLINNAGMSLSTKFAETPWEEVGGQLQLMLTSLTELSHRVAPGMKERQWGRIVNLSSITAMLPPAEGLLYSAIKSYVLLMSQSLDMELKPHGIHVTALCPGFTRSEFHDAMGAETRQTADRLPGVLWQDPEDVVAEGWNAVMKGDAVCVTGMVNKLATAAVRPIPPGIQYFLGRTLNPFK
ncbi:SDR family NAD(P)-dependent oxidoreductase [Gordonia sp. KTR9]|uniref:SDR family NAD(P)-dependent oxidoreductase n=1 Tax=Gordonia sp. KTR9 TaxID=337191 RepID=UPI00027DDF9F|nr:SDR family oxidoreductase [Gordonia sp. KTR9]AFR50638.1 short-chain dehydorgenase/reductase [Gordonia sp. KTR9]